MLLQLICIITASGATFAQDGWTPPDEATSQTLSQLIETTRKDRLNGAYKVALEKHIWYHRESRSVPGLGGVRVSFVMSDWVKLAELYPPAYDAMRDLRDEAANIVKGDAPDNVTAAMFRDFVVFNVQLGDDDETVTLFEWAHKNKPALAKLSFRSARPTLIDKKAYALCKDYVEAGVDSLAARHNQLKAMVAGQTAVRLLSKSACEVAVILANTDRVKEAKEFRTQLLEKLDAEDRALLAYDLDRAVTGVMPTVFVANTAQEQKLYAGVVDQELTRLGSYADLDDGVREKLKKALEGAIVKTALQSATVNIAPRTNGVAPSMLYAALAAEITEACAEMDGCQQYLADLQQRRVFSEQFIADDFLALLDREVWLTEKQYLECSKRVDEVAAKSQLPLPQGAVRDPSELLDRHFSTLLNKEQIDLWNRYFKRAYRRGPRSQESRREEVRADLKAVAARRIVWMQEELGLKEKKVRRLGVVAKSTFGSTSDKRADAQFRFDAKLLGQPVPDGEQSSSRGELSEYFSGSRWGKLVRNELSADQLQQFAEKLTRRNTRIQRKVAAQFLCRQLVCDSLTGQQLIGLRDFVTNDQTTVVDPLDAHPYARVPRRRSERDAIELLGAETWNNLPVGFRDRITKR